jgi:eukaryotic-like serine/threonine-protein kinase
LTRLTAGSAYTHGIAIPPGTRLGAYEITSALGQGGMGEVYRAKDSKLKRDVALKVLPADVATDRERLARFQREAEVLASLNHPHIAQIHGLEHSNDTVALVMELVEGDDLSQRIARGPIPLDEALPIASQIADALEAAHEQGIIHRDLKPANIKVRDDGTVKVLDFGLAKAIDRDDPDAHAQQTITSPAMTMRGMILGTAAYMAPEQAKGKPVDRRADMWAFGAVLYEMLTGHRAFQGEDTTDTIVAVVSKEPDWSALPVNTPDSIHKLLRRCLQKDRKRRLDSATAARLEIEDASSRPASGTTAPVASPAGARLPWAVAAVASASLLAALAIGTPWRVPPAPPEMRVDIVTPDTDAPGLFALSPDGRQIVFVARDDTAQRLWLRSLDSSTARPLEGTEAAGFPFWSPDGRSIAFISLNALKRIDIDGGAPQTLAPAAQSRGGTWAADGIILYAPSATGPLMRVSANGGEAVSIPLAGPRHQSNRWPHILPDGRRFLFYASGPPEVSGIYLGAIGDSRSTRLTPSASNGVYLPGDPGWLVWVRGGTLVAQQLDLASATLTGEVLAVVDDVMTREEFQQAAISTSTTGVLAYRSGGAKRRQLKWFDRSGAERGVLGVPNSTTRSPSLSPDGQRAVVSRTDKGNEDVWLLDGSRETRITFDGASDVFPIWSPDGRHVAFRSNRSGPGDIYQKVVSGAVGEEAVVTSDETRTPMGWSPDGRFLLYFNVGRAFNYDIFVQSIAGDKKATAVVATPFREQWGAVSPDGRWLAYMSDRSGRNEIYIRTFTAPGAAAGSTTARDEEFQISTVGGGFPVWRRDGRELYYLGLSGELMAVTIADQGATLKNGLPIRLFVTHIPGAGVETGMGRQYDVAPDGRLLINTELDDPLEPIRLLLNWKP